MWKIDMLFDDAHRRVCLASSRNETDRAKIWTGLAFPGEMRWLIKKGWMQPVYRETPRVLNWYPFTEAGWQEYDRRYADKPDWFTTQREG